MHPQAAQALSTLAAAAGEGEEPQEWERRRSRSPAQCSPDRGQGGGVMVLTFSLSLASLATVEPWNTNNGKNGWTCMRYTQYETNPALSPSVVPLAWSVAPPASVPVYCPLFSNPTPVILSDLSFSLVLTFLLGNQRVWQHLSNHWLNTDQNRTSCWKWLVSLSSKGRFWQQKHRMPLCPRHDLQMWSILASDSLPCTTVLFSPQVVTEGQFHWAPSTPSVRTLWLPALWRLLQSHRLPDASFVLGPMLSTGVKSGRKHSPWSPGT